jgi:hypothetical protein
MVQYDTQSLFDFLLHTPEGGLRKMLVDNNKMTAVHCTLLVKIVRSCSEEQFGEHFIKQDFPKIRLGPAETKIKEKFWGDCTALLLERGILQVKASGKEKEKVAA